MVEEAKGKMFYGYWVVAGAWLAMVVSSGAQFSLSIFMPALIKDFGWTRTSISAGLTVAMITMPLAGLVAGYLVDKIGPRWTVVIGSVIGAVAMFLLSQISQIWHFIVAYGVLLATGIAMSYMIATVSTVRRWFMKRAALMVAIAMTGSGFGMVLLVPTAAILIMMFGWREAYMIFGVILLVGGTIGGLLLKKDPESEGTYPDGEKPDEQMMKMRADYIARAEKWSVAEVFKTSSWWYLNLAQMGYIMAVLGLIAHMITWGTVDLHIPRDTMVKIFSFIFVMSAVVGRLVTGFSADWLMSRFGMTRKPFLYLCTFGVAVGMFFCPYVKDAQALILASIILGFSYGSGLALFPVYLGDLFGVVNMPVLFGYIGLFIAGFGSIGPLLYGISYDKTGSYDLAFMITGVLCVISGIFLYLLKPPVKAKA
jgi:MFS family permease